MKRALVLGGGGARGAYEIGAWQAFDEAGFRFHAVYGTSIGALNAGLFAQGDLDRALRVWETIDLTQVAATDQTSLQIDLSLWHKRDVLPLLVEHARHLRMDIAPLEALVKENIREGRVRACGMTVGCTALQIPRMIPVTKRLSDMPEGSLGDWLIASASCFPVFAEKDIGGEKYIDGGYFDNLPIDMAIEDGCEAVVAVDLHPQPAHAEYAGAPWLTVIHPLRDLGGFLDFRPEQLVHSRLLGRNDALKALGRLDGVRYSFLRRDALALARRSGAFAMAVARFDALSIRRDLIARAQGVRAPLLEYLTKESPRQTLSHKQLFIRGLEACLEALGYPDEALYDADALTGGLIAQLDGPATDLPLSESDLRAAADGGPEAVIRALFREVRARGRLPEALTARLAALPRETTAALYLAAEMGEG